MHVDSFGRGDPVVLLHGLPVPPSHLEPLARALEDRFRVLLPHLPGYGRSPSAPRWTVRGVIDELVETLLARDARRVAAVGYSFGGYLAFALALDPRLEVTRIVGLAAFAHYTPEERARFAGVAVAIRAGAPLEDLVEAALLPPGLARERPGLAAEVRRWSHACSAEDLARQAEAIGAAEDLVPRLASCTIPVTLRVGSLDRAAPVEKARRILAALPGAELQVVPGRSHALLSEDPEGTLAAVRRALFAPAS